VRRCKDCGELTGRKYGLYCDAHRWTHRGKPSTYKLTPEREAYMRAHYKPAERGTSNRCAAVLGVPRWRVCRWAAELGLTSGVYRKGCPNWTREQDAFLEKHVGKRHINWIARQLGRSITAVQVRIRRLELSRLPDGMGQSEVALAFGVSRDTVDRWHRLGLLTSAFSPMQGQPYRYTRADLLAFVRTHHNAFQLAKVDQLWFLDLVFDGKIGAEETAQRGLRKVG